MLSTGMPLFTLLAVIVFMVDATLPRPLVNLTDQPLVYGAMVSVLNITSETRCSIIFFPDGRTYSPNTYEEELSHLMASWGAGVFEVAVDSQDANVTKADLTMAVNKARRLRQVSWCPTVVLMSDDPSFLASFAETSLDSGLVVPSTRLLAVTRLPLSKLHQEHKFLSRTNSMILLGDTTSKHARCSIYVYLPFSPQGVLISHIGYWTPNLGVTLTTPRSLFPDKFSKFTYRTNLMAAGTATITQTAQLVDDPRNPGKKRLILKGSAASKMDYIAEAMNFSYTYIMDHDGTYATVLNKVIQKEADFAAASFAVSHKRTEVVDFVFPVKVRMSKIMAGRGSPEVDPWGFLFPLTPLVWVAILISLLVLPMAVFLLTYCLSLKTFGGDLWLTTTFSYLRVLFQQDLSLSVNWWWWERLVLGVWMLMTLVLTRSYSGNLMSLLAVRHVPHPYQSLEDVVQDPSTVMIWKTKTIYVDVFRSSKSGIFREVGDLEKKGRVIFKKHKEISKSLESIGRRTNLVLLDTESNIRKYMRIGFSQTGRCDLYNSREGYMIFMYAMALQKNSPLTQAVSKRTLILFERGLPKLLLERDSPRYWSSSSAANSSSCAFPPTKITGSTILSVSNLSGMFLVLVGGNVVGLLVYLLEVLSVRF